MTPQRKALTPEQINALSDADLISMVDPTTRALIVSTNRGAFSADKKPKKLDSESVGEYRRRKRASEKVDETEFLNAVRRDLRGSILAQEKSQAFIDKMTESIDPAEVAARDERMAYRQRQHDQADRESGRLSGLTPPTLSGWEGSAAKAKPTQAPPPAANPTRPNAKRSRK